MFISGCSGSWTGWSRCLTTRDDHGPDDASCRSSSGRPHGRGGAGSAGRGRGPAMSIVGECRRWVGGFSRHLLAECRLERDNDQSDDGQTIKDSLLWFKGDKEQYTSLYLRSGGRHASQAGSPARPTRRHGDRHPTDLVAQTAEPDRCTGRGSSEHLRSQECVIGQEFRSSWSSNY